ncbi:glutathione S-transferase 1-like, partial [Ostrinia furnacalis]|uniref:glutathione S-transferase 1-like n=1 Tax=Ostrinia furnacalis TaxID=93504 RepID=UPI001038D364
LFFSHAICGYLVNKYGKDDRLYPTEPRKRALIDQRLHFDSSVLFVALKTTVPFQGFYWTDRFAGRASVVGTVPVVGYPKLTAWLKRCSEQEFYQKGNAKNIVLFREMIRNKLGAN